MAQDTTPDNTVDSTDEAIGSVERGSLNPFKHNRHFGIILAVVLSFVFGPYLSQLLSTYRGIAIDLREGKALLAFSDSPQKWYDAPEGIKKGDIVEKDSGTWVGVKVTRKAQDRPLVALHERYNAAYQGIVIRIIPPRTPDGPSVAVLKLAEGGKKRVEIWATHLATLTIGSRLIKDTGGWSPYIDPDHNPDAEAHPEAE